MVYTCLYYILIIPPIYDKSGDGTPSLITMEQRRWEARASTANKARVIAQLVTEVSEKTSKWPQFQVAQGFMFFFFIMFFSCSQFAKKTSRNNTADCSHHPPWLLPRHSQCTESSPCHHSPTCRSISRCSSSKHLSWLASYQIYCVVHQTKARATSSLANIQKGDINSKTGDELDSEIQAHWVIGLSESRVLLFFLWLIIIFPTVNRRYSPIFGPRCMVSLPRLLQASGSSHQAVSKNLCSDDSPTKKFLRGTGRRS